MVVEGEAGIGKSRLIEATAQMGRDAGLAVLSSQAEQLEAHRPFGAIIDCIGQGRLGDRWDAWELGLDRAGELLPIAFGGVLVARRRRGHAADPDDRRTPLGLACDSWWALEASDTIVLIGQMARRRW